MTIVSPLLLALVAGVSSSATAPPPEPAPWPSAFFAGFAEWITPFAGQPVSSGSWAYSYATGEWRAEHDAPQANNFCGCASNSSASCALIFSATGHMYVDFFGSPETCCRLCDAADGCSVLKPDWLSAAPERVFVGASIIGGRECYEWCIPGDYATADCFAFTADQTPCRYSESVRVGMGGGGAMGVCGGDALIGGARAQAWLGDAAVYTSWSHAPSALGGWASSSPHTHSPPHPARLAVQLQRHSNCAQLNLYVVYPWSAAQVSICGAARVRQSMPAHISAKLRISGAAQPCVQVCNLICTHILIKARTSRSIAILGDSPHPALYPRGSQSHRQYDSGCAPSPTLCTPLHNHGGTPHWKTPAPPSRRVQQRNIRARHNASVNDERHEEAALL